MDWIVAVVQASALKLSMLVLLALAVALALYVWKMRHARATEPVPEAIRRMIDERAAHKVNGAVAPIVGRVVDLEGDMRNRETEAREHRDRIIRMEAEALHAKAAIEESRETVSSIYDRLNTTDGKLNRIMGHLGVKTREDEN